MSMREYGIDGFGIAVEDMDLNITNLRLAYTKQFENEMTDEEFKANMYAEGYLQDFIDYTKEEIQLVHSEDREYIMIYSGLPCDFVGSPIDKMTTIKEIAKFIYEQVKEITNLTEDDFIEKCGRINDTYLG